MTAPGTTARTTPDSNKLEEKVVGLDILTSSGGVVDPFQMPGPVSISISAPSLSTVLPKDFHVAEQVTTAGNSVEKPAVTPPPKPKTTYNDRAAAYNHIDVDDIIQPESFIEPSTFTTSSLQVFEKSSTLLGSMTGNSYSKHAIHDARSALVATTTLTNASTQPAEGSPSPVEPIPQTQHISPVTVGWIVAIIVACIMTGLAIYLTIRSFSARSRRISNIRAANSRIASTRQSRGTELS